MQTSKQAAALLVLILTLGSAPFAKSAGESTPRAVKGILDLRGWDFTQNPSLSLDGQWVFFQSKLLTTKNFSQAEEDQTFVNVPDSWHHYVIGGKPLPRLGYGTFRLTIYLPAGDQPLALYLDGQGTAYKLMLNGEVLASDGRVGKTRATSLAHDKPKVAFLPGNSKKLELSMQISNFQHRNGGFRKSIFLGTAASLHHRQLREWFVESISMGILAIMGLYHLFFFGFRTRDRSPLFFSILCWICAIRTGVTNQCILIDFLPGIDWALRLRIEYLTFFLSVPSFVLFLKSLYPLDVRQWFVRLSLAFAIIYTLFMLLTDSTVFTHSTDSYQLLILLQIGIIAVNLGQICYRRRKSAAWIVLACLVLFTAVVLDILYYHGMFPIANTTPYGFLAFIFVQALILSKRFSEAFGLVEKLSDDLRSANEDLEQRVAKRTADLFQAKEEARKSADAAEKANQAKSVFLANMSHELRTPLNAIIGFSSLMAKSNMIPPAHRENTAIINRNGQHLLTLINQVLDLSKIETGRITLNETQFDLLRMIDDLKNMFMLKAREKGLRLIVEQAADLPRYIQTDDVKLRQVLINILNNAFKFTQEGGVALKVAVKGQASGNDLQVLGFEIEDTGPGISPAEIEMVFEPFAQTATGRREQEGTGLGLTISRKFVQLMGGDIKVKSVPHQGTIFSFHIVTEILTASSLQMAEKQSARIPVALAPGQGPYRILIVDDNWENRYLLVKLLEPYGFELAQAADGREALDLAQSFSPHLIWMDMRMPVMNGREATRKIKALPEGKTPVIVAMTASAFEDEKEDVLAAGCDDYLRKPYKDSEIFQRLEMHLGVEFVYDDPPAIEAEATGDMVWASITEELSSLPPDWKAKMKAAAGDLDHDSMVKLIEAVRKDHPAVANLMDDWVENFDYPNIIDLIAKA